jgi:Tfp pilus assembly protein PilN
MIKINLLRSTGLSAAPSTMMGTSAGFEATSGSEQKLALGKLGVLLLFPLLIYAYEYSNISTLKEQEASAVGEAQKLEDKKKSFGDAAPRVEKFKQQKAKIDRQMSVIRVLAKNRLQAVKALDAIQELTPPQIWYSALIIDNGDVVAQGFATSYADFQPFYNRISSSPIFSNFNPIKQESTPTDVNGRPAYKFEVRFHIGKAET